MILLRNKYFAGRDYAGLSEDAQTYLKSARRNYARELIDARRTEDPKRVDQLLQNKSNLRGKAIIIDNMLKDPKKVSDAKQRIKSEVGVDRRLGNIESGKLAETRISRLDNYSKDPLLKNKETRAARAEALKAERLAKQPAKASYVKPEAVVKQPVVQPKASYVKPESVVKPKVVKKVQNKGREELVKTLRAKKALGKNLKKAGYVGLGVAGAAGLAVGAKKLYDRNKVSQQAQQ